MTKDETSSKVRWKDMVTLLVIIFTISVSVCMGALAIHSTSPHKGAVTKELMAIFIKNIDGKFISVEKKLDKLEGKIDILNSRE